MPPLRNPFDVVNLSVLEEIVGYREKAAESKAIPIGTEKMPKRDRMAHLKSMAPEERAKLLATMGRKVLETL
ncbi:hypothetical protein LCGC14_0735950 [marine sediment metagenome]|uniref:Uncharacterized protein n=1 Tax=marine sediment metagenome TaxID=412755 RepID=A0A0F9TFD2_9ZZZZ